MYTLCILMKITQFSVDSSFPICTNMEDHTFNMSVNFTKEDLEDFEEFDLRDAINVGAYSVMSASKVLSVLY